MKKVDLFSALDEWSFLDLVKLVFSAVVLFTGDILSYHFSRLAVSLGSVFSLKNSQIFKCFKQKLDSIGRVFFVLFQLNFDVFDPWLSWTRLSDSCIFKHPRVTNLYFENSQYFSF